MSENHHDAKSEKKSRPLVGVVSSDKMDKSRVLLVIRNVKHAQYGKYTKMKLKLMFHDEKNETHIGDKVMVIPARPRSSRKRFDLLSVVERSVK